MNKIAIVTGASSGIGHSVANRFIEQGYKVINISRRPCDISAVTNIKFDLSEINKYEELKNTIGELIENNSIITLVHNAGLLLKDSVNNVDPQEFNRVMNVNVIAPSYLNTILIPYMRPGSSIIYIGSTLSEKAVPGSFTYVSSKHAVAGMMKATCQDLMGQEIHTCCVCPGFTDTEMLKTHVKHDKEVLTHIASLNAYGRLASTEEMADVVLFASATPVINGSILHANLGQKES